MEKMCDTKDCGGSNSLLAFLLGLGIGGVLGILYAPEKGEDTRRRIKFYAEDATDKIVKKTQEFREEADAAMKKVSNEIKAGKEKVKSVIDAGRNAFQNEQEEGE